MNLCHSTLFSFRKLAVKATCENITLFILLIFCESYKIKLLICKIRSKGIGEDELSKLSIFFSGLFKSNVTIFSCTNKPFLA